MPERDPTPRSGLLTERISRQLRHEIVAGERPVGSKLPSERELSVAFGASRNVVREVLRRLEALGLIEVAPGRGSFVADHAIADARSYDGLYRTSRPTVRQVMEARLPIEVETVGLATERADDAALVRIRAAHDAMLAAPDVITKAHADLGFHDAIAAAAGNPVLRSMLASISGMTFEVMLRSNSDPSIAEPGVPHHPEIVAAIEARDVALARHCMREHLLLGTRTYGADLEVEIDVMASRHIETLLH